MLKHRVIAAFAAIILAGGITGAAAQDAPPPPADPGTRCGGLLCDMGIVNITSGSSGHRLDEGLPCGIICRALGGQPAPPPPEAAPVVAETAPPPEPVKKVHRVKHKHVAKAKPAEPTADAAPKAN